MLCMSANRAKDIVMGKLREKSVRPTELLELLEQELSYADIQDALSELLHEGRVRLNTERHLSVSSGSSTIAHDPQPK